MRFLILILLCVSCGDDNFPKVEKLDSFRVLGIRASNPEIGNAGGPVTLNLILSDINGSGPISGTYEACIDPGISRGAPVTCAFDPNSLPPQNHTVVFAGADATLRTGIDTANVLITVPAGILTGRSSLESNNGVGYIVIFRLTSGGNQQTVFKRILVSNRTPKNLNPSISGLFANGTTITTLPADKADFLLTANAPEQYQLINVDGVVEAKTEDYEVAWYTNVGEFSKPKADVNEMSELKLKSGGPAVFIGILRDERGGIDVAKVSVP